MKNTVYFSTILLAFLFGVSCNDGIDPISKVEPGQDTTPPTVTIGFPLEGSPIRTEDEPATVNIKFEAKDDIELTSVSLKLDNAEIQKYTDLKDYRQLTQEYSYNKLTAGNHTLTITATDLSGKSTTKTVNFVKTTPYKAKYAGEVFYMPFDGDYTEQISNRTATKVGSPGFGDGKMGKAYAGATDAYLTFPTDSLIKTKEISAVFWMKVNATPLRAGILTASAEDKAPAVPGKQNFRNSGFRFFREASGPLQQFKLNVGTGNKTESWNDGGKVDPAKGEWVHFAFTVSGTVSTIYINGVKTTGTPEAKLLTPIDWTGVDVMSIMSGVPRFVEWEHFSDLSLLDELRFFKKALTVEEVNVIYNTEK